MNETCTLTTGAFMYELYISTVMESYFQLKYLLNEIFQTIKCSGFTIFRAIERLLKQQLMKLICFKLKYFHF